MSTLLICRQTHEEAETVLYKTLTFRPSKNYSIHDTLFASLSIQAHLSITNIEMDVISDEGILHITSYFAKHMTNIRNLRINIFWKDVTSGVYKDCLHHSCRIQGLKMLEMFIEVDTKHHYPTKDELDTNMFNSFNLRCARMVTSHTNAETSSCQV